MCTACIQTYDYSSTSRVSSDVLDKGGGCTYPTYYYITFIRFYCCFIIGPDRGSRIVIGAHGKYVNRFSTRFYGQSISFREQYNTSRYEKLTIFYNIDIYYKEQYALERERIVLKCIYTTVCIVEISHYLLTD